MNDIRALIVDDEEDIRLLLRLALTRRNEGLVVTGEAADGRQALAQLETADPKVIVLDQMMPGMDGLQTASEILKRRPSQLIVLWSAMVDGELEARAARTGITACMRKGKAAELADFVHALASGAG